MTAIETIQARRSIRKFKPDSVERKTVQQLLEAAVHGCDGIEERGDAGRPTRRDRQSQG